MFRKSAHQLGVSLKSIESVIEEINLNFNVKLITGKKLVDSSACDI